MCNPKGHKCSIRLIGMKPADVQDQARLDQDQMREEQPFRKEPDEREWLHFPVGTSGRAWTRCRSVSDTPPPTLFIGSILERLGRPQSSLLSFTLGDGGVALQRPEGASFGKSVTYVIVHHLEAQPSLVPQESR